MSDLIQWFEEGGGFTQGTKAPHKWVLQAEQELRIQTAALADAEAAIAHQQVMLDRALEAGFDDKARADRAEAEIARLRAALADLKDEIDNSAIEFERPTFVEICEGIIRAALTPKP